jgi:probable Rubsico expression protein CbbX
MATEEKEDKKSWQFGQSAPDGSKGSGQDDDDEEQEVLPDDATVDVAAEKEETSTEDVLDRMERELVGLRPVKTRVREIADLLVIDRLRRKFGIESTRPTLHMCFTGSPGTGKTTVALRMAELLKGLGYLSKGHLTNVTRDDLVGQYIGHTAPKTREVLKRAMGGVLFIDEAYYLYRAENERDYGQEAIEILLQIMENERENIVVILAGYKDKMDVFFQSNPGMGSRIAHHIDFPDYSVDELVAIAKLMLKEQQYEFSPEAEKVFRDYLSRRIKQPRFANARSVRNAIERARLRQASRLVNSDKTELTKQDLLCIDAEDILKSRVFSDEEDEAPRDNGEADKGDIDHAERSGEIDDVDVDGQGDADQAESDQAESDEAESESEASSNGSAEREDESADESGDEADGESAEEKAGASSGD